MLKVPETQSGAKSPTAPHIIINIKSGINFINILGANEGTRTLTRFLPLLPQSSAYTIPPRWLILTIALYFINIDNLLNTTVWTLMFVSPRFQYNIHWRIVFWMLAIFHWLCYLFHLVLLLCIFGHSQIRSPVFPTTFCIETPLPKRSLN